MNDHSPVPDFEVLSDDTDSGTLLCGFSEVGLAGLTAVEYLVEQLKLSEVGHVTAEQLPAITPFEDGTPRHHTRLYGGDHVDVTILVGELLVPPHAAGPLAEAVLTWTDANDVDEVVAVSGVPVAHGPDDHRAFYVASPDYQAAHDLAAADVAPMPGGYLDGLNGAVTGRGIDSELRTCVFSTPAHAQTPDVEAALRLVGTAERVYDLNVDTGPLQAFAAEVSRHYEELAQQLREQQEESRSRGEDRMYM